MSTFGKVLVGLIAFLGIVWMILAAGNAQKNKNWQAAIQQIEDQTAKAEKELEDTKASTLVARDQVTQEQVTLGQELAVLRAKTAEAEHAHSSAVADLLRAQNLQATCEAGQKAAEENRDQRTAEVKAETEALTKMQNEVKDLQAVNKQQMDRLTELRTNFVTIQKANLAQVSRLSK